SHYVPLFIFTTPMTTEIYTLSLHDALPISVCERLTFIENPDNGTELVLKTDKTKYRPREKVELDISLFDVWGKPLQGDFSISVRSEEHTSELQSRENLVCRLLLEKKNKHQS